MLGKVLEFCDENRDRFVIELKEFCRHESVSADPTRAKNVADTANWLAEHLEKIGMDRAEVFKTSKHPIVFAEKKGPEGAPTVLIYGHYDVQPVDPLELWNTPPFEATIKDGAIYGRGVADDKGQVWLHIKAVEAYLKIAGELPVTVKMIFEGEEEIGSPSLKGFLEKNADLLACDTLVISDTSMLERGLPSITYALRGLTYMQIDLEASATDLHSGSFGGSVANPANVLAAIIASMKDANNHIAIAGFYDDVLELTENEKQQLARLPHNDESFLAITGAPELDGEAGFSTLERIWARPTLDVNGIWGGYQGEGAKTVLPSKAGAKISMRLVPNQDPETIAELFEKHVDKVAPGSVRVKVTKFDGGYPFLCPLDDPNMKCAAEALKLAFGKEPVFAREGGSIPIVTEFQHALNVPVLLLGFSIPGDNAHAPNEVFLVENLYAGIRTSVYLLDQLAKRC